MVFLEPGDYTYTDQLNLNCLNIAVLEGASADSVSITFVSSVSPYSPLGIQLGTGRQVKNLTVKVDSSATPSIVATEGLVCGIVSTQGTFCEANGIIIDLGEVGSNSSAVVRGFNGIGTVVGCSFIHGKYNSAIAYDNCNSLVRCSDSLGVAGNTASYSVYNCTKLSDSVFEATVYGASTAVNILASSSVFAECGWLVNILCYEIASANLISNVVALSTIKNCTTKSSCISSNVDVKKFIGNGDTGLDDISTLIAAESQSVELGSGSFNIQGSMDFPSTVREIKGAGVGKTILVLDYALADNESFINLAGNNVILRDLTVVTSANAATSSLVGTSIISASSVARCDNVRIECSHANIPYGFKNIQGLKNCVASMPISSTAGYYSCGYLDTCSSTAGNGFLSCYSLVNCSASSGTGFKSCRQLSNCSTAECAVGFESCSCLNACYAYADNVARVGFKTCLDLAGCKAAVGGTNAVAYLTCKGLAGCSASGTGIGFSTCEQLSSCYAYNSASYGIYQCIQVAGCYADEIYQCYMVTFNRAGSYTGSYASLDTSVAAAATAAGGFNQTVVFTER